MTRCAICTVLVLPFTLRSWTLSTPGMKSGKCSTSASASYTDCAVASTRDTYSSFTLSSTFELLSRSRKFSGAFQSIAFSPQPARRRTKPASAALLRQVVRMVRPPPGKQASDLRVTPSAGAGQRPRGRVSDEQVAGGVGGAEPAGRRVEEDADGDVAHEARIATLGGEGAHEGRGHER